MEFQKTDLEYHYTQCERHSFAMASSLHNNLVKEYFLSFDEYEGQNKRDYLYYKFPCGPHGVVRQCVNQFVISEEDQIEVTGYNDTTPCQIAFCLRDYELLFVYLVLSI